MSESVVAASADSQHRQSLDEQVDEPVGEQLVKQLGFRRGDALMIVDMQRDFLPGGSLAVPHADEIIAPINAYLAAFTQRALPIFLTRDWHPAGHVSFQERGGPWPVHCVQGTAGAAWAEGLQVPNSAHVISKGTNPMRDAYSAFANSVVLKLLRAERVRRLFIAGVATDYCVRATVLDARALDFAVVLLADAIRGVNREYGDDSRALREMMESGATLFERRALN